MKSSATAERSDCVTPSFLWRQRSLPGGNRRHADDSDNVVINVDVAMLWTPVRSCSPLLSRRLLRPQRNTPKLIILLEGYIEFLMGFKFPRAAESVGVRLGDESYEFGSG